MRAGRAVRRGQAWIAAGGALTAALLLAPRAQAEIKINPQGWRFPNIVTSAKEAIKVTDRTPIIPGRETINRGYRKADGTYFMTFEIEGKIYGVEIDEDGKPPFEYSILDTDGDGKFETMIVNAPGNKDRAYVPQWVIDYYFKVHPDVKPGPGGKAPAPSFAPPPVPATPAATPPAGKAPAPSKTPAPGTSAASGKPPAPAKTPRPADSINP